MRCSNCNVIYQFMAENMQYTFTSIIYDAKKIFYFNFKHEKCECGFALPYGIYKKGEKYFALNGKNVVEPTIFDYDDGDIRLSKVWFYNISSIGNAVISFGQLYYFDYTITKNEYNQIFYCGKMIEFFEKVNGGELVVINCDGKVIPYHTISQTSRINKLDIFENGRMRIEVISTRNEKKGKFISKIGSRTKACN